MERFPETSQLAEGDIELTHENLSNGPVGGIHRN
jgi:hypothetical protein